MDTKDPELIDDQLLEGFMDSLALTELKEQFKIRPEDFETRLDLQCYLIALQVTATDKDFLMPISGKPQIGKSTLGIWVGLKTVEALRKEFHVELPEFSVETDIHYPPISEHDLLETIDTQKPPVKMFDRVVFDENTLAGMGFGPSMIKDLREGVCVYFSNMKTRRKGYKKFENDTKDIFQTSFIYDLMFTNPLMPEKNNEEFCDILITFFDSLLIVQCKECALENPERLTKSTIVDGLNQLKTSVNRAKARSVKLFMVNSVKIFEAYDFSEVKDIHPILIVNRKLPFLDYSSIKDNPEIKKLDFVPIILSTDDLKFLASELDTPSDMFAYFKKREQFIANNEMPFRDERELLSYYLMNDRSFDFKYVGTRYGVLAGFYEEYKTGKLSALFAQKKELDKASYWVDDVMRNAHLSYDPNYLKALEELFKLNRVQRRRLAQKAEEKRDRSIKENGDAWGLMVFNENPDIAFVVYFTPDLATGTKEFFQSLCFSGEYKAKVKKVVGIAETTGQTKYRLCFYSEKIREYDQEAEKILKNSVDRLWGEGSHPHYGEFTE